MPPKICDLFLPWPLQQLLLPPRPHNWHECWSWPYKLWKWPPSKSAWLRSLVRLMLFSCKTLQCCGKRGSRSKKSLKDFLMSSDCWSQTKISKWLETSKKIKVTLDAWMFSGHLWIFSSYELIIYGQTWPTIPSKLHQSVRLYGKDL